MNENSEPLSRLADALGKRFSGEEACSLAALLSRCCRNGSICYVEIDIAPELKDDIILLACEERLLLPMKSTGGSAWEDRILSFEEHERYHVPRVVKLLVEGAEKTGRWDLAAAVEEALRETGEDAPGALVRLLNELKIMAPRYELDIGVIRAVRAELGVEIDMHDALDRFVRCGIASPRTSLSLHTGSAKYELNPCLFWET